MFLTTTEQEYIKQNKFLIKRTRWCTRYLLKTVIVSKKKTYLKINSINLCKYQQRL